MPLPVLVESADPLCELAVIEWLDKAIAMVEYMLDQFREARSCVLVIGGHFGRPSFSTIRIGNGLATFAAVFGARNAPSAPRTGRSHSFAGQLAGLLHPSGELSFVELVDLVDVEVAHFLLLGLAGGRGRSDVPRKKATLTYFVKQWMPRNH
jgi:hypothetical protein